MNNVIAKNRSGWILHEFIDISEAQISEYPNVTGAYAIVKVGDEYLIGYNDWRKQWEFPAGGIEEGETARQAAYRELFEETHQSDMDLEFKGLFKVTDSHGIQKYQAVVNINRVAACHDANNPKSGRVMDKAGMKLEGTLRATGKNNKGILYDKVWHSMIKSDRC